MNPRFFPIIILLTAAACLFGCQHQPPGPVSASLPATPVRNLLPVPSLTRPPDEADKTVTRPGLVTLANSGGTVILTVGQSFGMQLGPSPGSAWLIHESDPTLLSPTIHQLGPEGSLVHFVPTKEGSTTIEANSHGICLHPGPCPEVFLNFVLNVRVLGQ
jgi:hypothetical protein